LIGSFAAAPFENSGLSNGLSFPEIS
jgi:hypothetical protein